MKINKFLFVLIFLGFYSQYHELSLDELCSLSDDIIIAKPVSYYAFQSENKKHIYTKINFEVIEAIKGRFSSKDYFEMIVYGGKLNGITQTVIDAPTYMIGEESILFLSEHQSKEPYKVFYSVTAGVQGKFNIYTDQRDGLKKVQREQEFDPLKEKKLILLEEPEGKIRLDKMISLLKSKIVR